jgi:putative transposase
LCAHWGVSRQAFYAHGHRLSKRLMEDELVADAVRAFKRELPNSGGRKALHCLRPVLDSLGIRCGRDRFFGILAENGLLVPKRRTKPKTTDSAHGLRIYPNLLWGRVILQVFEALVVDITYVETLEGFLYLALVTDVFSRKVVGHDASDSLELDGCLRAVKTALGQRPKNLPENFTTHHSDRGSQYCSHRYIAFLKANHVQISMAATGSCYENAMAERVNGILKTEFGLGFVLPTKERAKCLINDAIRLYNNKRPHLNLNYLTPDAVFNEGIQKLKKQLFVS